MKTFQIILNELLVYQVFAVCSAIFFATSVEAILPLCLIVIATSSLCNFFMSLVREKVKLQTFLILVLVFTLSLMTLIDYLLTMYYPEIHNGLKWMVGITALNTLIVGNAFSFARVNRPWLSLGIGFLNALSYSVILILISLIREFFYDGTIFGNQLWEMSKTNNFFLLPSCGFLLIGSVIWVIQHYKNTVLTKE
ncbi:MAG: hypothetical protein JNM93_12265 [Bacteriovoracaceae bacterium]|nr:hypothetical protein [Bacteriovoracaceae bacterium]